MDFLYRMYDIVMSRPELAAIVTGTFFIGGLTYLVRDVPKKLFGFIYGVVVCRVTLSTSNYGIDDEVLIELMESLNDRNGFNLIRDYQFGSKYRDAKTSLHTGTNGLRFFWYDGRLCWLTRFIEEVKHDRQNNIGIIISILFGRREQLDALYASARASVYPSNKPYLRMSQNNEWGFHGELKRRDPETVITNGDEFENISGEITTFLSNKPEHDRLGIPWTLGFLLHGEPGTGKTSLVRAIASHFGFDVFVVTNESLMRDDLVLLLGNLRWHCNSDKVKIVLVEDIDTATLSTTRSGVGSSGSEKSTSDVSSKEKHGNDLSAALNAFDGIRPLEGIILIATTNHKDKLDPALLRTGRFGSHYYLGKLNKVGVIRYVKMIFGEELADELEAWRVSRGADWSLTGSEILGFKEKSGNDETAFLTMLKNAAKFYLGEGNGIKRSTGSEPAKDIAAGWFRPL